MDEILERELREMLDRHKIQQVLNRYARGIDRYDVDLVRSAFHEDAVDCHGLVTVTLDEFVARVMPELRTRDASQHFVMNQSIDLDGDSAHSETYFVVVRKLPDDDHIEHIGGRYVDRFERRDGDWRIALRVVLVEWEMRGDGSLHAEVAARYHRGTQERTDPSYERPLRRREAVGVAA